MQGKMVYKVKSIHGNKPQEVTLPNGDVIKTVVATEDPKGDKTWVRVIEL